MDTREEVKKINQEIDEFNQKMAAGRRGMRNTIDALLAILERMENAKNEAEFEAAKADLAALRR